MTLPSPADGEPPEDIDAAFEQIIAGLAREKDALEVTHPRLEDSAESSPDAPSAQAAPEEQTAPSGDDDDDWGGVVVPAAPEPQTAEERFVPPEPSPLPRTDAITTLAWIAVIAAPALYIVLGATGVALHAWQLALLAMTFVGSFGLLVSRMRTDRAPDEPDDGAVV